MEYEIGDKIMHPAHGAGEITAVKDIELVEGFEHYYEIRIPAESLTLNIPMRKMDEMGVRPVMKAKKLERVLETLSAIPEELSDNYKSRLAVIDRKIKSGEPIPLAEAVRDMTWRDETGSLTRGDAKLLSVAREQLAAEMALVMGADVNRATRLMDQTLEEGFREAEGA
jgi:CarD family transcriptional regulator